MKEWLSGGKPEAERFGLDEFIRRVSQRARVSPEEAERAVFSTLRLSRHDRRVQGHDGSASQGIRRTRGVIGRVSRQAYSFRPGLDGDR